MLGELLTTFTAAMHAETDEAVYVSTCEQIDKTVRIPREALKSVEQRMHSDAVTVTIALHTARDLGIM